MPGPLAVIFICGIGKHLRPNPKRTDMPGPLAVIFICGIGKRLRPNAKRTDMPGPPIGCHLYLLPQRGVRAVVCKETAVLPYLVLSLGLEPIWCPLCSEPRATRNRARTNHFQSRSHWFLRNPLIPHSPLVTRKDLTFLFMLLKRRLPVLLTLVSGML